MTLAEKFDDLIRHEDYSGIGNLSLEVLLRPHQEHNPDAEALLLEKRVPGLVRRKFNVPEHVTVTSVYRDQLVASEHRDLWAECRYVELLISAYILGASRENLPAPFDKLVKFFKDTAAKQEAILRKVAADAALKDCTRSAFAERVAKIQAEYERRKKILPTLGLDKDTLERLDEAEDTRFRNAILALGDNPDLSY